MSNPAWTIPDEHPTRCEALCGAGTYDPEADGYTRDGVCPDCDDHQEAVLCP